MMIRVANNYHSRGRDRFTNATKTALGEVGFEVGTVQDFLGLTDEEMEEIEERVRLGKEPGE